MATKPRIVRLRKGKTPEDSQLVRTLISMLELARAGKLLGYAMVTLTQADDGQKTRLAEAACVLDDHDKHHLLGGIRRMELNFIRRNWPDEDDAL